MQRFSSAWAVFAVSAFFQSAQADTFYLRSGGQIDGDLMNASESPRKSYVISVAGRGQITLQADVVEKVEAVRPELAEYEKLRRKTGETVVEQMSLAEWCREHGLSAQRKTALEHVLQLDPEQPEARKMLGYRKVKDQWMTHDEEQIDKGYVKSRNPSTGLIEWVPPQVAENRDSVQRRIKSEAEWRKKIHGFRALMDGRRSDQGQKGLYAIHDPAAIVPLSERLNGNRSLKKDPREDARQIYVEVLGRFNTHDARGPLTACAIDDPVEEVRLSCLDVLEKQNDEAVTKYFEGRMRDKHATDEMIERAGVALGRIKDPTSVATLVHYVSYERTEVIPTGGGPGSMTTTFGKNGGPSGLSMNAQPKTRQRLVQCRAVLDALVTITGQNFGYDPRAWQTWYKNQVAAGAPIAKQ
jgi:hypothetical protein